MHTVIVTESSTLESQPIERFRQTVDTLDMLKLIEVVNQKPKKPRADKGTKRPEKTT